MRILFAGTPSIAVPTLRSLAGAFDVAAVLTSPDKPQKRSKEPVATPVKACAVELGLPVIEAEHLGSAERKIVASYGCDTLVCFAFGKFFGPKFLALFSHAALNIHPSLLPVLRGPSPIQGAIVEGLSETGISIQKLAAEMDSGDLAAVLHIPLDGSETTASLTDKVALLAADLAVRTLSAPLAFTPQSGEPTFCKMITKEDGVIDWTKSAQIISGQIRGLYPWPKASTLYHGETLFLCSVNPDVSSPVEAGVLPGTVVGRDKKKGIAIATGDGLLFVTRLQKAMKKENDAAAFLNGERTFIGERLGV